MTDTSPRHAATSDGLEARLVRLEAVEAARVVAARYADACDARDAEAVAELFTADGVLEVPGRLFEGRPAVLGFYRHAFETDPSEKSHFLTNLQPRVLGDGQVALDCYFLYTAAGDVESVLGWGQYHDLVRADTDGARFQRKSILVRRHVDVREGWALGKPRSPQTEAR